MKILFLGISGYEYPHVRVRCYTFAEQLRRHGIDAEVLSFSDHLAPDVSEADMYRLRDRRKLRLILKSMGKMLGQREVIPYLQKLHYHTVGALILHRLTGRPYILDYDDYEIGTDPHGIGLFAGFNHPSWNRRAYGASDDQAILERTARRAAACIASSHALAELLTPLNPHTYRVETGVDTDRFTPGSRRYSRGKEPDEGSGAEDEGHTAFVFLWTGLVWGETIAENLFFAVDALSRVRQRVPHAILRIIGGGPYLERVIEYARANLPEQAVEIVPWVSPDRMPEMLRKSDAGLLPMVRDVPWTRSKSPTKLFEYLAAGLPVVASPTGEATHVIDNGHNGRLAGDMDDFVAAMRQLAQDAETYRNLSQNARKTAETRYSQAVLGERLAGIISALFSR
ncbi:MAG TPA: glycosyltransferase [bacterium]|nr:glycosyltransferase [bacterium]